MPKLRTPLIKPRQQGGTFYTFGSALEDVGLNINELKNKVSLSHYVLLNIPSFEATKSFGEDKNTGDYTFAENFQNYALNMETVIRNMSFGNRHYNFSESLTVSERVFWKWMKTQGFISFTKDLDSNNEETGYYIDSSTFSDDSVIKGFGLITAGAQRTDAYGIYNETFVQIPSSYGQMKVLLKPVNDTNYFISNTTENLFVSNSETGYIENIDESELISLEDPTLPTGLSAVAIYDNQNNKSYSVDSEEDELCVEFSLSKLREYYSDDSLMYDDIGIGLNSTRPEDVNGNYEFNAVLVYYSIYDSTGKNIIATNAYGLLLLDSSTPAGEDLYKYPSLLKKQSSAGDSGNSYSFRLNIKTTSVYNGDIHVEDNSTPAYEMSTEFNDVIKNLSVAVETLRSNANLISVLCNQNSAIKGIVVTALDKIDDIEKDIKSLKSGNIKSLKVKTIEADAASINSLDSSISISDESTVYGTFNKDTFTYEKIHSQEVDSSIISSDTVNTSNIETSSGEIIFNDNDSEEEQSLLGKINSLGIFTENSLYVKNGTNTTNSDSGEIDKDVVANIIKKSTVKSDYTIVLPGILPQEINSDQIYSNSIIALNERTGDSLLYEQEGNYINLPALVYILLAYAKNIEDELRIAVDINSDSSVYSEPILSQLSDLNLSINNDDANNPGILQRLSSLETTLEGYTQENYGDDIERLDSSVNNLSENISDLSDDISNLSDDVDDIKDSVDDISEKVNDLDSSVEYLVTLFNDYNDSILASLNSIIND